MLVSDGPRGVGWLGVLRVHRLFLSVFLSIQFSSRLQSQGVWRTVHLGPRTVRVGCVGHGRVEMSPLTVRYCWCGT
jgi:hypothetical protein